jgi:SPX domain protein involved in polyphosphate accumulation
MFKCQIVAQSRAERSFQGDFPKEFPFLFIAMKFGQSLSNALNPDWKFYYLDYDRLKLLLKVQKGESFNESNEENFIQLLETELEKIANFCHTKSDEFSGSPILNLGRVKFCESTIQSILLQKPINAVFARVEDEMNRITTEVGELSGFIRLNYSGFVKV